MKLEQAARQALDAVINSAHALLFLARDCEMRNSTVDDCYEAITALREALAEQAEQEPVGVVTKDSLDGVVKWNGWIPREGTKLYAAPVEPVKQEPVGYWDGRFSKGGASALYEVPQESAFGYHYENYPLYAAPVQQAEQEPVAWLVQYKDCHTFVWGRKPEFIVDGVVEPLYAAPVRTKDLTDDEIDEIGKSYFDEWSFGFARAVISADRELNK